MSLSKISLLPALALFGVVASSSVTVSAQQPDPMSPMNQQLAKLGGTMQAVAEVCGDYSTDQLAKSKKQQKSQLLVNGMSESDFDKAFTAGLSEAKEKWKTVPESQRKGICDDMKQQIDNLVN